MNVLIVPTWYSDFECETISSGIFHFEQAVSLSKYCSTAVYYPFDKTLGSKFMVNNENSILTYRSKFETKKIKRISRWVIDFWKIKKEFNPDVINAHVASGAGFLMIMMGFLFRIPVVITEHCPVELMNLDNKKNYFKSLIVYKMSKINISVSDDLKNKLNSYFKRSTFTVIYNGVYIPSILDSDTKIQSDDKFNCCIVGSFYNKEVKGYQYLLPSIKNLHNEGYNLTLHICGDGEYLQYYKSFAKDLGIDDYCVFYGYCNKQKVYSIIDQMDFCISASLFESAGVFVEESMLIGKPLVVTKSGGASSLVSNESAVLVEKGSIVALEEGIKTMLGKIGEFDTEAIKEYALYNFEIDSISKKYINLFQKVMKGGI